MEQPIDSIAGLTLAFQLQLSAARGAGCVEKEKKWKLIASSHNPYGDGKAAGRIPEARRTYLGPEYYLQITN